MNQYHVILKDVLLAFGVHGPRHVDMSRTNIKIRERKKKKTEKQVCIITLFFKEIFNYLSHI